MLRQEDSDRVSAPEPECRSSTDSSARQPVLVAEETMRATLSRNNLQRGGIKLFSGVWTLVVTAGVNYLLYVRTMPLSTQRHGCAAS